jgi:hypothetical protein
VIAELTCLEVGWKYFVDPQAFSNDFSNSAGRYSAMSRYGRGRSCHELCEVRLRIVFSVITPEFHGKLSQDVRTAYIPDSSAVPYLCTVALPSSRR